MRDFTYAWKIVLRHSTQGFGRTAKEATGRTIEEAIADARRIVTSHPKNTHDPADFDVIEAVRGRIVS